MISELVKENRSCRRFYEDQAVAHEALKELVNLARMSASGANLQPLKYILSCDPQKNAEIFSCLAWAGYLKDWSGPVEGERPSVLGDVEEGAGLVGVYGLGRGLVGSGRKRGWVGVCSAQSTAKRSEVV